MQTQNQSLPTSRPTALLAMIALFIVLHIIWLVTPDLFGFRSEIPPDGTMLMSILAILSVIGFIGLWRQQRWAWWLTLILYVMNIFFVVLEVLTLVGVMRVISILALLMLLAQLVLLFRPALRHFRR